MFNWRKQLGDQSLHLVIGACLVYALATISQNVWIGAVIVIAGWIIREVRQWPSVRWYDPPIDWLFEALGVGLGVWWYNKTGGIEMWNVISWIGFGLVLLLCLFAAYIIYMLAAGGTKAGKGAGLLDRTAWAINGLFMLHAFLRHRLKVYGLVELVRVSDNQPILIDEGADLTLNWNTDGALPIYLKVKRPFHFLDKDLMETVGFDEEDGRVT